MLTINGVALYEDDKDGVAYFFTDERRSMLCKDCPMEGGKTYQYDENTEVRVDGCPCSNLKMMASGSISMDAYKAIKDAGMLTDLIQSVKDNDMPLGAGKEGLIKVVDK